MTLHHGVCIPIAMALVLSQLFMLYLHQYSMRMLTVETDMDMAALQTKKSKRK